ncbi:MAG: LPS assembly lipoprotein LptE [Gammaproteobacteria bacterium]|jgi:LPS-assembly lipoprotein
MNRRAFLATLSTALVAGCGFKLRRIDGMPFASLYLDARAGGAVAQRVLAGLRAVGSVRLTQNAAQAEVVLKLGNEERSKTILSLSGAGRVTEYRLGLRLVYSIEGREGRMLAAPETIELVRDLTYDDQLLLAKGAEEQLLYRDMDEVAAQRILRRLHGLDHGVVR